MTGDVETLERELGHTEQELWENGREIARALLDLRPTDPQLIPRQDSLRRHRERIQFMLGPRQR